MGFAAFLNVSTALILLNFPVLFRHFNSQYGWFLRSCEAQPTPVRLQALGSILSCHISCSSQKSGHSSFHMCLIFNRKSKKTQPLKHASAGEFTTGHWTGAGKAIFVIVLEILEENLDKKIMRIIMSQKGLFLVACKCFSVTSEFHCSL